MESSMSPHDQTVAQESPPTAITKTGTHLVPQSPTTLAGYTLEAEIGRGGMGVVYQGKQVGLNRVVAIKMVLSGSYASRAEIARFLGEAEVVASIKHPHIVQVYEFGESDGRPYFTMEFLTGGSLASRLKKTGPMVPRTAVELVCKLAEGIAAAHDLGIVHRDLKPDNVLFDADDVPKIVDFGLAKRGTVDLTNTGAILGTPAYMAPEQAAGRTKYAGPSVDVYSLGVILYEAIAGRVPFQAPTLMALLETIREHEAPRLRDFAPQVTRDLEQIIRKCLAKNPLDRYPSASVLAEDLQRFLSGQKPLAAGWNSLGNMWAVLDRSRHAGEFANYSRLFLWLAAIMVTADCAVGLWMNDLIPPWVGAGCSLLRVFAVPLTVYWYAGRMAVDGSPGSRFLLSLWSGYAIACMVGGLTDILDLRGPTYRNYVEYSLLTALAFIALGPHYWGWCYAFGVAFFAVALAMRSFPLSSGFLFAAVWGIALVSVSMYLGRLSREAKCDTIR